MIMLIFIKIGVIETQKLSMLSGIGPEEHLNSLNITVVEDLPVGQHLKDHVVVPFYFLIRNDSGLAQTPELTPEQFYDFYSFRSGGLVQFPKTLTYFSTEANDDEEYPDTCIYAWIESYLSDVTKLVQRFDRKRRQEWFEYYKAFVKRKYFYAAVSVVRIKSEGYVRLRSSDPFENPIIDPKYLAESVDFEAFAESVKFFYYIVEMYIVYRFPNT